MNFEYLLNRTHQPAYTCYEFVCEAWQYITGDSLADRMQCFLNGNGAFEKVEVPESLCIAFFYRSDKSPTHVGLFVDGRILHLGYRGVQYLPVDLIMTTFNEVRFYK